MPGFNKIPFPEISFISQYITPDFKATGYLLPEEEQFVEQSAEKRRIDFSTGRYCARQALEQLINIKPPILQGKGREPLWPDGVVGSISHSGKLTGAVVALKKEVTAMGFDIETIGDIKPDMWNMIFHDTEQQLIQSKLAEADVWATLLFSVKEAFYKLQYPLTGQFVDFLDIAISENNGRLCFMVKNTAINLQPIVLADVVIQWTVVQDQLLSICYISAKRA